MSTLAREWTFLDKSKGIQPVNRVLTRYQRPLFNLKPNVMKKFISLLTMVIFITGMAVAQNTATTSQTGDKNDAQIQQQGGDQHATVTQTDDQNDANVRQHQYSTNGSQSATVIQNGDAFGGNKATIRMEFLGGNGNPNTAYIEQIGDYNTSNQRIEAGRGIEHLWGYQEGNHNELTQRLGGATNRVTSFDAEQVGNYNKATQTLPNGIVSRGLIKQTGNHNDARQMLEGDYNGWSGPITSFQEGNRNTSRQIFHSTVPYGGTDEENTGLVSQFGDGNFARQLVEGKAADVDIRQGDPDKNNQANYNEAWQNIMGATNTASIYVIGDRNWTKQRVDGDKNNVSLWNAGNHNTVRQKQNLYNNHQRLEIGGDWNNAIVSQDGNKNKTYINMRGTGPGQIGSGLGSHNNNRNDLMISQNGDENLLSGAVTGERNDVDVYQIGNNNTIGSGLWNADGINIYGHSNTTLIRQLTNGNSADVNQLGNNNNSRIIQK